MQCHTHLCSDNSGHRGFTQAWWARQQNMVGSLPALFCRTQDNVEMFFQFSLPHKLIEFTWTQTDFIGHLMV
jgi:hypothetical protein